MHQVVIRYGRSRTRRAEPRGHAELAKQYFELVAALSEATLIGIDCAGTRVAWWAAALQNAAVNFDADPARDAAAIAASSGISAVVTPTVERLRKQPDDTVLSHMLHHDRPPGQPREYADVLPVLKHVILSVTEPAWLASGTLLALVQHPAQLAEVRSHRRLLGQAVYEGLRWLSPVGAIARRTTRPVTLGEQRLPADTVLAVSIASADHDENVFDQPEAFDIHRNAQPHFALGEGVHVCAAKAFVPAVARTALDVLFDRFPGLQLSVDDGRADPSGWEFRFPRELHATW